MEKKVLVEDFNFRNGKYFQSEKYIYMYIYICAQEEREAIRSISKAIKKKRPPSAAAVAALGASIHLIILGCNVKLTGERQTVRGGKYV